MTQEQRIKGLYAIKYLLETADFVSKCGLEEQTKNQIQVLSEVIEYLEQENQ